MGKTRAEIQKAYRERLKQKNNEEYLEKERRRRRKNYVPSENLTKRERDKRNKQNRENLRHFYRRKREDMNINNNNNIDTSGYESVDEPRNDIPVQPLQIRFPFNNRRKGALKRWKRDITNAKSKIKSLEIDRDKAKRKLKSAQRSIQRLRQRIEQSKVQNLTPRKETENIMKEANLTKNQRNKIRKQLLLGNVLVREIREAKKNTPASKKSSLHKIISGQIVKKYRCISRLGQATGLCRHKLATVNSKRLQNGIKRRKTKVTALQQKIVDFLEREDNSRCQPGKKDAKKIDKGEKVQSFVLTDYLSNLYRKFISENPEVKISMASFCRSRPKYILTTSFISRWTCLCTKHQNVALTAKSLKKVGIVVDANPERMVKEQNLKDKVREKLDENTPFKHSQWKRVEIEEKGKQKYVTKILETTLAKQKFISIFEQQVDEFISHVERVNTQYDQIRTLKDKLPPHNVIVQMDFAENYSCKSLEEVQSAYFNQTSVTLHPVVVYHKGAEGDLLHRSFIIVSDEMAHKAGTVITFVKELIPTIKSIDPALETIHYWTDSPSSQYRNRHIFNFVANHKQIYGITARWNYFEAGHGKGPCDGLGGTCKRMADEAMRSGKVIIQDAKGFFEWAISSSMKNIKFKFVPSRQCEEVTKEIEEHVLKTVKGTMKIHCVVGLGNSKIKVKDVSCYCNTCLSGVTCESEWKDEITQSVVRNEIVNNNDDRMNDQIYRTVETVDENLDTEDVPSVFLEGDFVAAVYENRWYIGRVVELDNLECEISFMAKSKNLFKWPNSPDEVWIRIDAILCKISEPMATGRSQRMFRIQTDEEEKIERLFVPNHKK